jgi:hypothetical protein
LADANTLKADYEFWRGRSRWIGGLFAACVVLATVGQMVFVSPDGVKIILAASAIIAVAGMYVGSRMYRAFMAYQEAIGVSRSDASDKWYQIHD